MTFLSEDPTYLAGFLVLVAGAFLMALKVTQQGEVPGLGADGAGAGRGGRGDRAHVGDRQRADRERGL